MAENCGWCDHCRWPDKGFQPTCDKCDELPIDPCEPACNEFKARDDKTGSLGNEDHR